MIKHQVIAILKMRITKILLLLLITLNLISYPHRTFPVSFLPLPAGFPEICHTPWQSFLSVLCAFHHYRFILPQM